jgi:hypothetical protein
MSGVAKNVVVNGGADYANFTLNGTATFGQNITLTSRGPANFSMDSRTTIVNGNLTILSGRDVDTVSINGPRIKGTATIRTGDGGDTVSFDNGAVFEKTVVIDTGAGDDFLRFARTTGTFINAVTFTGVATVRTGTGNDLLELGRSDADGGDTTTSANFVAAGSTVDGGMNLNSFDDETGRIVGSPTLLNWTDPTNVG